MKSLYLVSVVVAAWTATAIAIAASTKDMHRLAKRAADQNPPACAVNCLDALGCSLDDTQCFCGAESLSAGLSACAAKSCSVIDSLATQKFQTLACGLTVRNQAKTAIAIEWALFGVSVLAIIFRFLARSPKFEGPGYGRDDYAMLFVLALLIPHQTMVALMIHNGLAQDFWMIPPAQIRMMLKSFWIGEMFWTGVVMFTKVAILFLYLRIFPKSTSNSFRITCWIFIGLCVSACTGIVFAFIFSCDPISGNWRAWDGEHPAKCANAFAQSMSVASINVALDLAVFLLPIPQVWALNMSVKKRIGVALTFLIGLFVTVISTIRLAILSKRLDTANPSWDFAAVANWSQAEVNLGVLCACMPSFARLIKRFWTRYVGSKISSALSHHSDGRASRSRSRKAKSHYYEQGIPPPPIGTVVKTVDSAVVYNRKNESSDEVELVEHASYGSQDTGWQHQYVRDW